MRSRSPPGAPLTGEAADFLPGDRSAAKRWRLVVALVLGLALLLGAASFGLPLERDEGEYAYIAWRWLEGDVPYLSSFDQKPPGIFAAYAVILSVLGDTPAAIHLGAQLYTLISLALLMNLVRRMFGALPACAAGLLCALAIAGPGLFAGAANTEKFALLPLVAGVYCSLRAAIEDDLRWAGLAGLAAATALLFKWVVVPMLVFQLALHLFWTKRSAQRRLAHGLAASAGGALALAPVVAYFAWTGALAALIDATVLYNLRYATSLPLSSYYGMFAQQADRVVPTLAPLAVVALLGPIARWGPGAASAGTRSEGRQVFWGWGWLAASLLAASGGGYFRPHYFIFLLPPLTMLAGAGLSEAAKRLPIAARLQPAVVLLVVGLLFANAIGSNAWYFGSLPPAAKARKLYSRNPFPESLPIADFIAERSEAADRIFIFGSEPQIYFYARRQSATRYIYVYPLTVPGPGVEERQRRVLAQLMANPPRFIISVFVRTSLLEEETTPRVLRAGLVNLVSKRYRPLAYAPQRRDGSTQLVTKPRALSELRAADLFRVTSPKPQLIIWERI